MSNPENDQKFLEFPEKLEFIGVGDVSLKTAHLASLLVIVSGLLISIFDFPNGLLVLGFFLLIVLGFEIFMIRRARSPVIITLFLRQDPVKAMQGTLDLGEINKGTIDPDMEGENELGFRPDPKKPLLVWEFRSKEEKGIAAKRLLMYLQRDPGDDPSQAS